MTINISYNSNIIQSIERGKYECLYYYKWRNSPPFDAFESNVYHISAPRYNEVLQKRINYTLSKIEMDGKLISNSGILIKPGQRLYLKRFMLSSFAKHFDY